MWQFDKPSGRNKQNEHKFTQIYHLAHQICIIEATLEYPIV